MVSGELEKSLRDEVEGYINGRLNGLQEEIARLQSQINEALTRLLEHSKSETQADTSVTAVISEHLRAAHERGIEAAASESRRAKTASDMAIIKAAVDDIDNQRTQTDILNAVVNRAASFAPRVAFFVIKNEQAMGWRARGLEGTVGDDAIRQIALPLSEDTPLKDAVQSRATWSGAPGGNAADHLLINKLGAEPPQRMAAVPLVVRGRSVAVLYADSAALDSDAINLEALETLMRVAGMGVELLAVGRAAPIERPARVETQTPAPTPPPEAERTAAQRTSVRQPAPEPASPPESFEATSDAQQANSQTLVAQQPAVTAEPHAESTAEGQHIAPLGTAKRYGGRDAELPVEVNEDERRLHNDARRFARLLVSEIKLYNEQKVQEGRSQGDIYERLREDIDRSRQMYDKRVAPPVAARYDYFHQELVNTLAEGDPAKLGDNYQRQ